MFFEIGAEIVGMKVNRFGHLIDADARMKTTVYILLYDVQTVHLLGSVLQYANRNGFEKTAYDF